MLPKAKKPLQVERLEDRWLLSGGVAYTQLPLRFEANQGQADPQVRFLARGSGYTLLLTPQAAVLRLQQSAVPDAEALPDVLRLQLVGGAAAPAVIGQDPLPGTTNYFVGKDPARWRTGVPTYGRVTYQGVYPGIDLAYYGNQQQLEYDFDVAPGADPGRIDLAFQGAARLSLDDQGDLVLPTAGGDLVEHAPVLYQQTAAGRQPVSGRYMLHGDGTVGFDVGTHDPALALVIDPVLSYATFLGGSNHDEGTAVTVDATGAAYVTGWTASSSFPTLTPIRPSSGNRDAFVLKVNPDGSPAYFTFLGGSQNNGDAADDQGLGIAVDGSGNAYVTGLTQSSNFPTTPGAYQAASRDASFIHDGFVARLDATGKLSYATYLGGTGNDAGQGIAVDSAGNVYVTGVTTSADITSLQAPLVAGFRPVPTDTGTDAFVARFDPTPAGLLDLAYFTYLGGDGNTTAGSSITTGNAIAVDGLGNAYVTGSTNATRLPVTSSAFQPANAGGKDAFVAEINPSVAGPASLVSCSYLGGADGDSGNGIAVDGQGNAYVAGTTTSSSFPAAASLHRLYDYPGDSGRTDAFVAKVHAGATALDYFTYLGGSGTDTGAAVAVDGAGNAYVTGSTMSTNFPTVPFVPPENYPGGEEAFLTEIKADGTAAAYSAIVGSNGHHGGNWGAGVAVDRSGQVWVTGATEGPLATVSPVQGNYGGGFADAFLLKISPQPDNLHPGNLQLDLPSVTVEANAGSVTLTVTRTGGSEGTVTVHYATYNGSAVAGVDYDAASGDLTFANGETSKTITLTVRPDNRMADARFFGVTLSAPTGGATLGNATALVTIPDNIVMPCSVLIQVVRRRFSPARGIDRVILSVWNVGNTVCDGPLWLVLGNVPPRVFWWQQANGPRAVPRHMSLPAARLNPGDRLLVSLTFARARRPVRFTAQLVTGAPPG
jgi:hypothetical protein